MQAKTTIYDAEDVSNELGQAIHDAKRKMLKEYRGGASLRQATIDFIDRCTYEFERVESLMESGTSSESAEPANASVDETETADTEREREYQQWREERYGKGRVPLTDSQIRDLARQSINSEPEQACALLLLLDEMEVAEQAGTGELFFVSSTIRDTIMPYTAVYNEAHDNLIKSLRLKLREKAESEAL